MTYQAPQYYSVADFPADETAPAGMKTLQAKTVAQPQVLLNVPYCTKRGKTLHLHILRPGGGDDQSRYPLVMWVQGSAFQQQNVGSHLPAMLALVQAGFVVAMVQYRWTPEDVFPAQVQDLHTATRFMLAHAAQYRVAPAHVLAFGDSSGGHTVTLGVMTTGDEAYNDEDVFAQPLRYAACVEYYGPMDMSLMNDAPATQDHQSAESWEGQLFGGQALASIPELVQEANPITHIDDQTPPFLIMHGTKDRVVPFSQSVLLYEALRKAGKPVTFYRLPNEDHSTDAFFSPETMAIVAAFLQANS